MKDKKGIEENNLDELMNNLFLEENRTLFQEESARFILQQGYAPEMDADKEKKMIQKLNKKLKGGGGYWKYYSMTLVLIIAVGAILYNKKENPKTKQTELIIAKDVKSIEFEKQRLATKNFERINKDSNSSQIILNNSKDKQESNAVSKKLSTGASVYYPISGVGSKSVPTFFKPTEQDFVFYHKEKKNMLESLMHIDKGVYSVVEGEKMLYHHKLLEVSPFILRDHMITNLEYKIFLAETMEEEKVELLKKAVVKNELWMDFNDNILATTYFFDGKYNDFPVVNISPEAAILFCEWLEKEINDFSKQMNPQAEPMRVHLPSETEILLALKKGYQQHPDCNGYQAIYDTKDGQINPNSFKFATNENNNAILDNLFSINRFGMDESEILQVFEKGFNYKNKSINQSTVEVFSKVAHVSEIIREQESNDVKIVGSCWKSKRDYTKMVKAFNKSKASPFVGFRVAIVYRVN